MDQQKLSKVKLSKATIGKFAGETMDYGDYLTPADVDRLLQNAEMTDKELLTDEELKQLLEGYPVDLANEQTTDSGREM